MRAGQLAPFRYSEETIDGERGSSVTPLRKTHRLRITEKLGRSAGNRHRVLEHLYEHPIE